LASVLGELVGKFVDFFLDAFGSASNESQVRVEFAQLIPELFLARVEAQHLLCSPLGFAKDFKVLLHQDPKHVSVRYRGLAAWHQSHGRDLDANELYAAAKMRLFRAFDQEENLRENAFNLVVDETNFEEVLEPLALNGLEE
jgi:hypothetical protein